MRKSLLDRNRGIFNDIKDRLPVRNYGPNGILIYNVEPGDANFHLVAGTGPVGYFKYASAFVRPDGSTTLLVQELEVEEARKTGLDYIVGKKGYPEDLFRLVGRTRTLGVNSSSLPHRIGKALEEKGYELVDVSDELTNARVAKTRMELDTIRRACDISARAALEIPSYARPGMTELEVAAQLEYRMKVLGGQGLAFETIIASGSNSAAPHHMTGRRELRRGDFLLADFGCTVDGLVSDITRTFVIGKPTDYQQAMYEKVLDVQEEALEKLKVGVDGHGLWQTADKAIRRFFSDINVKGQMGHGLGHGIGYFIHDGTRISKNHYIVPAGLMTTIEPGAYDPDVGGVRIEDDVLVKSNGKNEILTAKAPKGRLIEIPLR